MATDIVPTSENFVESNMKPVSGEPITATFGQNLAGNDGYNKMHVDNAKKPLAPWGRKVVAVTAGTTTTTPIVFATDKIEGIGDTFNGAADYTITFGCDGLPAGFGGNNHYSAWSANQTTTGFDLKVNGDVSGVYSITWHTRGF